MEGEALARDLDVRERGKLRKTVVQFIETRREYWRKMTFWWRRRSKAPGFLVFKKSRSNSHA